MSVISRHAGISLAYSSSEELGRNGEKSLQEVNSHKNENKRPN